MLCLRAFGSLGSACPDRGGAKAPARRREALLVAATFLLAWPIDAQSIDWIDSYFDGDVQGAQTIDGLNFAWATAVSPDGRNVYACSGVANFMSSGGADDNAVATFARAANGTLTFVEAEFDDQDGGTADGLFSCRSVVVSPDGKHVYTAGSNDNKIGIFSRDIGSGALTFLAAIAGVQGLGGAQSLAISPDGSALFVAGRADDAIAAFSRESSSGALTFEDFEKNLFGGVTGLDRPLSVAVSPDGHHVYVASGSNANFSGSDAITVFEWNAFDGTLAFLGAYAEGDAQGIDTIDGLDQVTSVAVSPDGRHVYAASENDTIGGASGNGNDWIAIFARDEVTGELTWLEAIPGFSICTSSFGGDAESFVVVSGDGTRVYVTRNWANNGVAMFERDPSSGSLVFLDGICELDPDEIGIDLPRGMAIDPSGSHLYVAGNASNALAAFYVPEPGGSGLGMAACVSLLALHWRCVRRRGTALPR